MGVNVTVIVQVALTARLGGQLLVWVKSALDVAMLVITSGPAPVLVRVTVCGALEVPTT